MSFLQFASLGSGSKGNGTLIRYDDCLLLIDCGFSLKETQKRLSHLAVTPQDLDAVIVTHEHGDHINGVGPLVRKYQLPVYMTFGTRRARNIGALPQVELIKSYQPFSIKSIQVTPVAVPHDAIEPAQYIFKAGNIKLGLLTDLGSITPHVEKHYQACDGLIVEANYDPLMLASGQYPAALKQRVGGPWGHLSNQQAADFLSRVDCAHLQQLVIAHISQQNNTLELAQSALAGVHAQLEYVHYACQQQGFDWISLECMKNTLSAALV